jgi:capsid portal protein
MRYFEDNTVPPAMLTVSGGRLTAESARAVTNMLNTSGADKQNRRVLVEAVGEGADVGDASTGIQIRVEKMTDARQNDELFGKYEDSTMRKILSCWRMTPAAIGRASEAARDLGAELQLMETTIFAPERAKIDEQLNKGMVNSRAGLRMLSAKLVSRTPAISSPDQFIKALTALNVMGAVTPRSAQRAANKALQIEVDQFPAKGEEGYEDWMDKPIIMTRTLTQGTPNDNAGSDPGGDLLANGGNSALPGKTHIEQSQKTPDIKATESNLGD